MLREINWRRLAPAGGFASPWEIGRFALMCRRSAVINCGERLLEEQLSGSVGDFTPVAAGSGTLALFALFSAVKEICPAEKDLIAMSGYTCPSIAAAAVAAGFRVAPLEVSADDLELESPKSARDCLENAAAVILSNLCGIPDRIEPWHAAGQELGFLVVDDACQAALTISGGRPIGQRRQAVGVLSFGRGKAISAVGGGMLLVPREPIALPNWKEELTVEYCRRHRDGLNEHATASAASDNRRSGNLVCELIDFGRAAAMWALERPALYRLPSSLPWLRLGETTYNPDFPRTAVSGTAACAALVQWQRREEIAEGLRKRALRWEELLDGTAACGLQSPFSQRGLGRDAPTGSHCVPTRYPVVLGDAESRDAVYAEMSHAGLGASEYYNKALGEFPALRRFLATRRQGEAVHRTAADLARRLLTLPVHRYVSDIDMERGRQIILRERRSGDSR